MDHSSHLDTIHESSPRQDHRTRRREQDDPVSPIDDEDVKPWEQRLMIPSQPDHATPPPQPNTRETRQLGHGQVASPQSVHQYEDAKQSDHGSITQIICYNHDAIPPYVEPTPASHCNSSPTTSSNFGFWKAWLWELLALLLAVGLLVCQFILLGIYSGSPTLNWAAPIGLNTLIAVLSTVARVILAFVATEVVAQIMWTWSTKAISLRQLEDFNQASRGAWAALKLLVLNGETLRRPDLLSALVVILVSLFMGPFSQQAVGMKECVIQEEGEATLPNIRTLGYLDFSDYNTSITNHRRELDGPTQAALLNSFADPHGEHSVLRSPSCSTGNCTFPVYRDANGADFTHRSLGFCNSCVDMSWVVERQEPDVPVALANTTGTENENWGKMNYNWTVPDGGGVRVNGMTLINDTSQWLFNYGTLFDVRATTLDTALYNPSFNWTSWLNSRPDTVDFLKDYRNHLVLSHIVSNENLSIASIMPGWGKKPTNYSVSCTSCALYPCIKTYLASVDRGKVTEKLITTDKLEGTYGLRLPWIGGVGATPDMNEHYLALINTDTISVRTPCVIDGKIYTSENISSAPGTITFSRWDYGELGSKYHHGHKELDIKDPGWEFNRTGEVNITAPPECIYAVDLGHWYLQLQSQLQVYLDGGCMHGRRGTRQHVRHCYQRGDDIGKYVSTKLYPYWLDGFGALPTRSRAELSDHWDKIAESMTRVLRMAKDPTWGRNTGGNGWRNNAEMEAVRGGKIWRTTTCYAVDFKWLMLPTVVTGLTLFTLVWTIFRGMANGDPVWKSSILPLIYYRDRMVVVDEGVPGGVHAAPALPRENEPLMSDTKLAEDSRRMSMVFNRARTGRWSGGQGS